jgi:nitrate/nitrite transport system substrate-binding protein
MATSRDDRPAASRARRPSRRDLIKQASATAAASALLSTLKAAFPAGAHAQAAAGPEVTKAILGYIALIDASALVIAKEKGFFTKHGMPDVEVAKQASWGATRDNVVLGSENNGIDGAHILTPMPYLISTGKVTQNHVPTPMYLLARTARTSDRWKSRAA